MRASAIRGLLAAAAALAGLGWGGGAGHAYAASGCDPVWTDASGDAYYGVNNLSVSVGVYQPELDLISGTFWQSGGSLVIRVNVADMEARTPPGSTALEWYSAWHVGATSLTASVDYTPQGTFYSYYGPDGVGHSTSGAMVTGSGGYVEVDVPLSAVGSPTAGTAVSFDGAGAWEWAAILSGLDLRPVVNIGPGPGPFVLGSQVDDASGGGSTVVGATCP
jgi:hypothetical protein